MAESHRMKVTREEPWAIDTKMVAKLVEKPGDTGRERVAMLYKWKSIWGKRHKVPKAAKDATQVSKFLLFLRPACPGSKSHSYCIRALR